MITASGCNNKKNDNTAEITVGPGDTLAEMTIQIGEETGKIRFKLFPEIAPKGVDNFVKLAQSGYYDGKTIHRVIKDFMVQGGSLRGNGTGGTTADKTEIPRETNNRMRAYYGALGYAEGSDGINSQFFIVNNKTPFDIAKTAANISSDLEEYKDRLKEEDKKTYTDYLSKLNSVPDDVKAKYLSSGGAFSIDGNYTIFGQAIEGLDFLKRLHRALVGSRPEYLVERVKAVYHLSENRVSAGKARNTASFLKGCYKLIGDYLCACFLVCIASQLFFVFFGYLKRSREEETAVRVALL